MDSAATANNPDRTVSVQIDRLESLVRRLLYFDKTQQEEELVSASLEAVITRSRSESVSLLRLKAEQQDVTLVYRAPAEPLPLLPQEPNTSRLSRKVRGVGEVGDSGFPRSGDRGRVG